MTDTELKLLDEIAELQRQLAEKDRMLALMRLLVHETKTALQAVAQDATLVQRGTDEAMGAGD